MRGTLAILICLSVCGLAWAQTPSLGQCPPYAQSIKLNFVTDNAPATLNNNLNATGLQNMARLSGARVAGRHQRALGLTTSQVGLSLGGRTYAIPAKDGYCVYLSSVEAGFGYRRMDVMVASEFPPGSCEYNAILDHENQHVAINRSTVREYAPRVRQELERLLQSVQPRFSRDPQLGSDDKLKALHDGLDPLLSEMERLLEARNAAIDTDYNYTAIGELCKNWNHGNIWSPVSPAPPR
jgi:hypothetical protein